MLKRSITYEDFNGNTQTDEFYFNLTKSELVELEAGYEGGLEATIRRIVEAKDNAALIREFKRIILAAYGERSEDGKRFVKNEELRNEFTQTAAYDALFFELATNETAASDFIKAVLPKDMAAEIEKTEAEAQTQGFERKLPPAPPST